MKLKASLFKTLSFLLLPLFPLKAFGEACHSIGQVPTNKDLTQGQVIDFSGSFCLGENLEVKGISSHGHSPRTSSSIIRIMSSNVTLDFRGNAVWSDAKLEAGIDSTVSYEPKRKVAVPPSFIVVRNGSIRLTQRGAGISIVGLGGVLNGSPISVSTDFGWSQNETFHESEQGRASKVEAARSLAQTRELEMSAALDLRREMPKVSEYLDRRILVEKMKIRTRQLGIVIQGAGTVIRDNVIEVDAGTAIWVYGPNARIENNTIIVHGEVEPKGGLFSSEADAPIRLHHGDGALVRNNRIIIAGKTSRTAISLFETGSIRVENNTIYGLRKDDQAFKAFLGSAQLSQAGNKIERGWKSIFSNW